MAAAGAAGGAEVPAVVSPAWLHSRLNDADVKVLDASWYLPPMGRDARAEHGAGRIPGARFWDVDGVADPGTDLPHMLPTEGAFAAAADALGVANGDTVVLYDGLGTFASPRAWWTWRVFGHERVAVLEGGLPAWRDAGFPVDAAPVDGAALAAAAAAARGPQAAAPTRYQAKLQRDRVRSLADVAALVEPAAAAWRAGEPPPAALAGGQQLVDARPAGRFAGRDPEPRAGLRRGHMPGARSLPFTQLYAGEAAGGLSGARLKPPAELAAAFAAAGVDPEKPLVCTCGSGLTACVIALAAHQLTGRLAAVYDGSWSEWGADEGVPVVSDE